ncbi:MAG: metalloenzyme [Verrucomicrobiota bacterium]|nr:metalloenzyme [Verrucomicrobiota bacterium]
MLFLFIDGVGLRAPATDNPVQPGVCPVLCDLIDKYSVPIDACLDLPGLPQSATGQTTMFTGVNASQYMGRHCEGFPGPTLRKLIEEDNLFMELSRKGLRCRFADAYMVDSVDDLRVRRFKSVTTVMALTQPETIAIQDDLLANQAVFHDITRHSLQEKGLAVPVVTPQQAAEHLIQVALSNDFTLFEMFQTDLAGHSCNYGHACETLRTLDLFLDAVAKLCKTTGLLLILTSDHGNIEQIGARGHTRNQVPLVATGPGSDEIKANAASLTDITPRITRLMVPGYTPPVRNVQPVQWN